jgi:hypothetical protein
LRRASHGFQFFGIALLDALAAGAWGRALFWAAVGVGFALLDRWSRGKRATPH